MNENDNVAAAAEIAQKAALAQQIQNTEAVKRYASMALRLISQAPFDGAEAPQVAEVLAWLDATVKGAEKQLVLLGMATPPPIKPEVVGDGK